MAAAAGALMVLWDLKVSPRHPNMALLTTETCERKSRRLFRSRLNLGKVAA